MKLVILSDIHANLEALQAVLADVDHRVPQPSIMVALGDMVGYGADPEAVVHVLRECKVLGLSGNHEQGVIDPEALERFNPMAQESVIWTRRNISAQTRDWLASLPKSLSLEGCRLAHGLPPADPFRYLYEASRQELAAIMSTLAEPISFVGHTHVLKQVSLNQEGKLASERLGQGAKALDRDQRHLINAGALGQPRDGDQRAKYLIFDPHGWRLEVVFLPYDQGAAAAKIRSRGLPSSFADRLDRS